MDKQLVRKRILSRNVYKSLSKSEIIEREWRHLLKVELDLQSTIGDFQIIEICHTDQKQKHLIRENFIIKKEIITNIITKNIPGLQSKLHHLHEKVLNQREKTVVEMFLTLLDIITNIEKLSFTTHTLHQLLHLLPKCSNPLIKSSMVQSKVLIILSLHLLKLKGLFMNSTEKQCIVRALQLKKKQFQDVEWEEKKQDIIRCLTFGTFEYYRIINLLKHDQHQILFYYENLITYLTLYKQKYPSYPQFEAKNGIQAKLNAIQPLYLSIEPYEDSRKRRILSLESKRLSMLNIQQKIPSNVLIKKKQSNTKLTLNSISKNSIPQRKSTLKLSIIKINNNVEGSIRHNSISTFKNRKLEQLRDNHFNFQFIMRHTYRVLIGSFTVNIQKQSKLFNIKIRVRFNQLYCYIINIRKIQLEESLSKFSKKLWRVIKQQFKQMDNKFIKMPGLINFAQAFIPQHIQSQQLRYINQIHQLLLNYFRSNSIEQFLIGPCFSAHQPNHQKLSQKQTSIFNRRIGFINLKQQYRTRPQQINQLLNIKFIYYQKKSFKFVKFLYINQLLKQVFILQFGIKDKSQKLQNKLKEQKLSMLPKSTFNKKNIKSIVQIVSCSQLKLNNTLRIINKQAGQLDYELQISTTHILKIMDKSPFKDYWLKKKTVPTHKKNKNIQMIKVGNKFKLVERIQYKQFCKYKNNHFQFLTLNTNQPLSNSSYLRIRMYKTLLTKTSSNQYIRYYQTIGGKIHNITQQVYTIIISHSILKTNNKYLIILQHQLKIPFQKIKYIYQIIDNKAMKKYIKLSQSFIENHHNLINNCQIYDARGPLADVSEFLRNKLDKSYVIRNKTFRSSRQKFNRNLLV